MMEWWHDCRMLVARYLIASDSMDRSGPVEAAVRAAGYNSEDEGEGSEEEEGSSVEEEQHHEEQRGREPGGFVSRRYSLHDDAVPAYTQNGYQQQTTGKRHSSALEMGPNGYLLEKKSYAPPGGFPLGDTEGGGGIGQDPATNGNGADVTRRPSKRQLEKAPEGRQPRMPANGHGAAEDAPTTAPVVSHATGTDAEGNGHEEEPHSRFRENL